MPRWWRRQRAEDESGPQRTAGGSGAQMANAVWADDAAPAAGQRHHGEPPGPGPRPQAPSETGPLSSVADKVQAVLEAAEDTAEAIRREAKYDATRVAEERRRQRVAASELDHLSRLAESLSVQAEAVKRQCAVLHGLLPVADEGSSPPPSEPPPAAAGLDASTAPAAEAPDRPKPPAKASGAGPDTQPGPDSRARPPHQPAAEPDTNGDALDPSTQQRVKAYRMKLAGADREEIESFLEQAGVDEPLRIVDEIYGERSDPRSGD